MPVQSVLARSAYSPAIGGHAPGDVRDAFLEAIEAYENWEADEPEPAVDVRDRPMRLSEVCGLVWNCSDIMPGLDQRRLEDLVPLSHFGEDATGKLHTYSRAARTLKALVLQNLPQPVAA